MTVPAGTRIGSLRVHGARWDSPRLRTAVSGTVAAAELEPPGLPPAAILIVRRLADPLPGRLSTRRPGLDPVWERACRHALDNLCGRAARPARGAVPPDAEAVLFADEAELLACLAADLVRGVAAERWWWRQVAHRRDLATLLGSSPEAVPGALSLLRSWGLAVQVVAALPDDDARAVLQAVLAAHAVPSVTPQRLADATAVRDPWVDPTGAAPAAEPPARTPSGAAAAGWRAPPPPPPLVELPPAAGRLGPEQAVLLAVALTLRERPTVAGSAAFRRAVGRWWSQRVAPSAPAAAAHGEVGPGGDGAAGARVAEAGGAPRPGAGSARPPGPQPTPGEAAPAAPARPPARPPPPAPARPDPVAASRAAAGPRPAPLGPPGPTAGAAAAAWQSVPRGPRPAAGSRPAVVGRPAWPGRGAAPQPGSAAGAAAAHARPARPPARPAEAEAVAWGTATELSGVLYLVNVMRRLDLPGCLEADWPPGVELGGWALLDALARGLLAGGVPDRRPRELAADPLWAALADLAGREPGAAIGGGCRGRHDHRLPAGWADADRAGPAERLRGPLSAPLGRCPRRWLAAAVPFLRRWLAEALGTAPGGVTAELLRPGRLHLTTTHVDAVMGLDAISLPVRLAGLDADPGWVPELGRVVKFHYR